MKKIFALAFAAVMAFAETLNIDNFETDLYSRDAKSSIKKVSISLRLEGRDVVDNEAYVLDALNVVIGSFYVEDLLTSLGKEKFKETLAKYTAKKHSVDIDEVLIISLKTVREPNIEELLEALKNVKTTGSKRSQKEQVEDILRGNKNQLKPMDLNQIDDFGKDFGEH
ncbi:hypothetical protein [Campylobacter showae]|uniref:Putative periplasmic protein n=1 Tax=Campylobacter showae CSUNSWCD TaxID=1244083 RepID=M5IPD0_9BACT|nr:hypothetical protein [Campylobacter showae]EKU10546.1 Putative periplasmic protein [Campylobacter showae CSUNSWCD]